MFFSQAVMEDNKAIEVIEKYNKLYFKQKRGG